MTTLLVASIGGHLAQLHQLRPRLAGDGDVVWVTNDSPQSRSLLSDQRVVYVPYVAPRDARAVASNAAFALRLLKREPVSAAYSTGSGIALAYLPVAAARRIPAHYIESAARSQGPSLTGRLLSAVPGVATFTQYRSWESRRWPYMTSVFDDFRSCPKPHVRPLRSVVVTLGTIEGYQFDALIRRLQTLLPGDVSVLWQLGRGARERPPGWLASLPATELSAAMSAADVVVAHAGIGSALAALNAGKVPVLVPRRAERGEHVDDHQEQIAAELADRDLAVYREVDKLDLAALERAAALTVVRSADQGQDQK